MTLTALIMTRGTSTTFLSLALGLGGLTWAGFGVNHLDVAPKYAAILMGISNTVGTIPGIICPSLTGAIVVEKVDLFCYNINSKFYYLFVSSIRLLRNGEPCSSLLRQCTPWELCSTVFWQVERSKSGRMEETLCWMWRRRRMNFTQMVKKITVMEQTSPMDRLGQLYIL